MKTGGSTVESSPEPLEERVTPATVHALRRERARAVLPTPSRPGRGDAHVRRRHRAELHSASSAAGLAVRGADRAAAGASLASGAARQPWRIEPNRHLYQERGRFYGRVLRNLIDRGVLDTSMSVLAVAAGAIDRDIFRTLGFSDVTLTNIDCAGSSVRYEPYRSACQDAESLTFPDKSFDWAVVSAGLHHCGSPHRALLELYRVARRGVLAIESRDSALMRLAIRIRLIDAYELASVAANDFCAGGLRDTAIPNFVYRWTEREVEKTIASYAPHARHDFFWFHEFELPRSILDVDRRGARRVLLALEPGVRGVARLLPSQANLFGFAVAKPQLPCDLHPWLRFTPDGPAPDEEWIRAHLGG
jgi:SAM-dependent methyltransferase